MVISAPSLGSSWGEIVTSNTIYINMNSKPMRLKIRWLCILHGDKVRVSHFCILMMPNYSLKFFKSPILTCQHQQQQSFVWGNQSLAFLVLSQLLKVQQLPPLLFPEKK